MSNTIIIAEIGEKNGWFNIKTNEGKEVSVMAAKAPKLAEQLKTAKPGTEITGKLVEKDGKSYLWDIEDKKGVGFGGKPFAPKDKSFDAAQTAIAAAASLYALEKDKDISKVLNAAQQMHAFLMDKITKTETK